MSELSSRYRVHVVNRLPLAASGEAGCWGDVLATRIAHFHPRSSAHRPKVEAKLLASPEGLRVLFTVIGDRAVRCRVKEPNGNVCTDSCVELFISPPGCGEGYFNFEANCGGTLLASWCESSRHRRLLELPQLKQIRIETSLPPVTFDGEIDGPLDWWLAMHVPLSILRLASPQVRFAGQWRGNLYKCADHSSLPHWAAWSPLGEKLAFHQPERFGVLEFE